MDICVEAVGHSQDVVYIVYAWYGPKVCVRVVF